MRIPTVLAAASIVLIAASLTACHSGSTAAGTSSAAPPSAKSVAAPGGGAASEIDACSLLTKAQASAQAGRQYASAVAKTIAPGQDQCTYHPADNSSDLDVIVYQPSSGVSWQMMTSVLSGVGPVKAVGGVGDKAMIGQIELDAQAGRRLVAVQGAGGLLTGSYSGAVAVAKSVISALP
ncbi:MAG TPA: hypothetical protein VGD91_03575 [Trebonia sp.]